MASGLQKTLPIHMLDDGIYKFLREWENEEQKKRQMSFIDFVFKVSFKSVKMKIESIQRLVHYNSSLYYNEIKCLYYFTIKTIKRILISRSKSYKYNYL